MNLAAQKKRMTTMFAINGVCLILAMAAVFVAIRNDVAWLWGVFTVLLIAGFGAQIWFMLGFIKRGGSE
ncbi:MAG: hypothetical protein WCI21_01385 [Alphaproteobacteria bacterium]